MLVVGLKTKLNEPNRSILRISLKIKRNVWIWIVFAYFLKDKLMEFGLKFQMYVNKKFWLVCQSIEIKHIDFHPNLWLFSLIFALWYSRNLLWWTRGVIKINYAYSKNLLWWIRDVIKINYSYSIERVLYACYFIR